MIAKTGNSFRNRQLPVALLLKINKNIFLQNKPGINEIMATAVRK